MTIANIRAVVLLLTGLSGVLGLQSPSPSPTPTPAETARPQKLRVSSGVAEGLILHKVNPVYPKEARQKHIQGDVILQVDLDKSGNVASVRVVQGEPVLAEASVDAVKQWKYRPYVLNGEPVEVETSVKIQFHM